MSINGLATAIVSGVLTLALVIGITVMAVAGVPIPDQFFDLLPVGFAAAIAGTAAAAKAS